MIHVTDLRSLESITRHGLVCPSRAAALGFSQVFGSVGSNRDVVQLLDFTGASRKVVVDNPEALIDGARHCGGSVSKSELRVLVLDDAVRSDRAFVPHNSVVHRCRASHGVDPRFRYVAWFETWFEDTLGWARVREDVTVKRLFELVSMAPSRTGDD